LRDRLGCGTVGGGLDAWQGLNGGTVQFDGAEFSGGTVD